MITNVVNITTLTSNIITFYQQDINILVMENLKIGEKIKQIMDEKHIKAIDLAKKINFTREGVYSVFKKDDINTKLLSDIAVALGVEITEFFGVSGAEYRQKIEKLEKVIKDYQDELFKYMVVADSLATHMEEMLGIIEKLPDKIQKGFTAEDKSRIEKAKSFVDLVKKSPIR